MATAAVDEDEDVLRCTVCLDSYTDPCTLQCKHSFCRRCITDYVKTQTDAVQAKRMPCPFCRQVTQVPDPSRPVDEWAGQLQPGHVVQELMATVSKETNMEDTPCSPCQQLGETTAGKIWCVECEEAYCQRCASTHSVMTMSSDHDLCDIKHKGLQQHRKRKCKEHKDQQLQLYCKECDILHCQLCFVDHHKKCDEVVTIKSFVLEVKRELSNLENRLQEQEQKCKDLVQHKQTRITTLNANKTSAVDGIRSASQKAIDLIKKKEKEMINQVEEMTDKETNELRAEEKVGTIRIQTYRQYREYIKHAVSSDNEIEVCGVYQVWSKSGQLDISQEGEKERGGDDILSDLHVFFHENENIRQDFGSLYLGQIISKTYLPTDPGSSPVIIESVDTRMQEDKKDPESFDITVLEVGGVNTAVVTDENNNCVKSFYTRNNKNCQSRLQFKNNPQGTTQLGDTNVMVAVPDSKQIVTVAVTPDLVKGNVINTSKKYSSLAVISPSRLAAGGYSYVDILNMHGEVMKAVTTHKSMDLFCLPYFMCVSNTGHLLVSDGWKETVTCLTPEGQVAWIYAGKGKGKLSFPRGITTTRGGDIFVADSNLKKVIQLSKTGDHVRDILTSQHGLRSPNGVCVDKDGTMYMCEENKILKFLFVRK